MNCPKCGGATRVDDVRHPCDDSQTLRSRVCTLCGYLFHTVESLAIEDSKFTLNWVKSYRPTTKYKKG